MLAYIYKFEYYRIIKTGFLVDYFLKKYILYTWTKWLIQFNAIFNDKYFIEYISKTIQIQYQTTYNFLIQLQQLSSIYLINFIILTSLLSIILINLWLY